MSNFVKCSVKLFHWLDIDLFCLQFDRYNRLLYRPQPEGSTTARQNSSPLVARLILCTNNVCNVVLKRNYNILQNDGFTYIPEPSVSNCRLTRGARLSIARITRISSAMQREEYDTIFTVRLAFKYGWGDYFIGLAVHARHTCESPSWEERSNSFHTENVDVVSSYDVRKTVRLHEHRC